MKTIVARLLPLFFIFAGLACAEDTAAPQVVSIAIAPGAVDVSATSQDLTVTLRITDDESGLEYANIYLIDSDNNFILSRFINLSQRISGTNLDGIYEVTATVPLYAKPGTWRIDTRLEDAAQRVRETGPNNEPYPVPADALFTVTNDGTIDVQGPAVESFAVFPAAIFTDDSSGQVMATFRCTEDLSGFSYGFIYVNDPEGNFRAELFAYFQDAQRTSGDTFDGTYTVPVIIPQGSMPGTWELSVWARDEVGNSTYQSGGTFTVSNNPPHSLGSALDATQFTWDTGSPGWSRQTTETRDGIDAAVSAQTEDSQETTFQTTVTGPGTLSFFWRVDSEVSADILSVTVDSTEETHQISGNTPWADQSVNIPAGAQTVTWRYAKNESGAQGLDRGWVDQVHFTAALTDVSPPILQAVRVSPDPVDIMAGPQSVTFTIEASDDLRGISNGSLRIINPFNTTISTLPFGSGQRVSGDALFGTYQIAAQIPETQGWGNWRVEVDLVEATSAKTRSYGLAKDPFPVPGEEFFTVWSGSPDDLEPPLARSISTTPAPVDVTTNAATLSVSMQIIDSYTGFSEGHLRAYTPAGVWVGSAEFDGEDRTSGDPYDGTYTVPLRIPQGSEAGDWRLDLYLRDESGSSTYQLASTFTVANDSSHSLANALDAAQFSWTTGNPGWSHQTSETHDGIDAAASDPTEDLEESIFQTTVTGPGTLSFRWRVDSEEAGDFLSVELQSTSEFHGISGNTAWAERSVYIPAGSQTVIWKYAKNGSVAEGEDRGWVDQVRFAGDSDQTPPVLQAVRISPRPVNVWAGSQTVTFTIESSDDFWGVGSGGIRLIRPSGEIFDIRSFDSNDRVSGDGLYGIYEVEVEIPDSEMLGTWRVEVDLIEETTSFFRSYGPGEDPFPNAGEPFFTVTDGTKADRQAPMVASISTAPSTVDVTSAAATVTVTLRITDDTSGFFEGSTSVRTPTGAWTGSTYFNGENRISGDKFDGIYVVEVTVPRYGPPGVWKADCYVNDVAGNDLEFPYELGFPAPAGDEFMVINTGPADTTAPSLSSISLAPASVNTSAGPANITVTVSISDDLSGFRDRYLFFYEPGDIFSNSVFAGIEESHRISGNELNGTYQIPVTIPQGSTVGSWQIRVFLRDRTGGQKTYGPGDTAYPSPGTGQFTVTTLAPPLFQAFIQTYQLTGNDAAPSADPDRDGLNNATELMLGTNPVSAASAGAGLITVTRDAGFLYLNFTIDPTLSITTAGAWLELRNGSGGLPFRLTGQTQAGLGGLWANVLPSSTGGGSYRIGLPLNTENKGFMRLFFEAP
ncbi:MAG: DUF7035 domain-containing protein [Luteolibacter sp.]